MFCNMYYYLDVSSRYTSRSFYYYASCFDKILMKPLFIMLPRYENRWCKIMLQRFSLWNNSGQAAALESNASLPKMKGNSTNTILSSSFKTTTIIAIIGILLGRSVILFQLLPFVVPFM